MPLENQFSDLFEGDKIEVFPRLRTIGLPSNSDEMLFQRDWPERRIEVKQTCLPLDAEEVGNVDVVWERGAETHDSDNGLT